MKYFTLVTRIFFLNLLQKLWLGSWSVTLISFCFCLVYVNTRGSWQRDLSSAMGNAPTASA